MKAKKPTIGITIDYFDQNPNLHQVSSNNQLDGNFAWYFLRRNYSDSIINAGGIPILLPYCEDSINDVLSLIDGLLITGGRFDVDPKLYGEKKHDKTSIVEERTNYEYAICKAAIARKMPILGICGGEQLLNVVQGGTLIQHIPDFINTTINHTQTISKNLPSHKIKVNKETKLYDIVKTQELDVNSSHHQGVKDLGRDVVINAIAPDGIIEGIEIKDYPFALGLQWHPEVLSSNASSELICESFINICRKTK